MRVVIIALGLLLLLLVWIGDFVGASVFGLVIVLLGWMCWDEETEKPREKKQEE